MNKKKNFEILNMGMKYIEDLHGRNNKLLVTNFPDNCQVFVSCMSLDGVFGDE